jgi:hypothetical protein
MQILAVLSLILMVFGTASQAVTLAAMLMGYNFSVAYILLNLSIIVIGAAGWNIVQLCGGKQ